MRNATLFLVAETEMVPRTADEVICRAIALYIVHVRAKTNDRDEARRLIEKFAAQDFFSPEERGFIDDPAPAAATLVNLRWRIEGVAVLLWATGIIADLPERDRVADDEEIGRLMNGLGTVGLQKRAVLRSDATLRALWSAYYDAHWAVRDAAIHGEPDPPGLNSDVVYERRYALGWLTRADGDDWDEISTDT